MTTCKLLCCCYFLARSPVNDLKSKLLSLRRASFEVGKLGSATHAVAGALTFLSILELLSSSWALHPLLLVVLLFHGFHILSLFV